MRLGGDALYSNPERCHSKTDGESGKTSMLTLFTDCVPRLFGVATMYTNQIEAAVMRGQWTNRKAGYNVHFRNCKNGGQTRLS